MYRAPGDEVGVDPARVYLGEACERVCDALGESVSFAVLPEAEPQMLLPAPSPRTIAETIDGYARLHRIDLIVMATHGRGGISRLWFGSVADALLRTSALPVLVIQPDEGSTATGWRTRHPITHVLVPLDGTDHARTALRPAQEIGTAFGARYTLLRVLALPYSVLDGLSPVPLGFTPENAAAAQAEAERNLAGDAETLRGQGATVATAIVVEASSAKAILQVARDREADLIVLATHARAGFDRILIGSVADKVVRGADCPVLVVRGNAADPAVRAEAGAGPGTGHER
jgi:nucleotide-binding universal stress UspA family protein